jgi:hypothetical protein
MLPALSGILPDSFSALRESRCLENFQLLRRVTPKEPPATCRRQRAECPRSQTQTGRFCITSFLQLRESDLLGLECFRSVASPSSHSSFCEEVCAVAASAGRRRRTLYDGYRMRWTGQIFWLLAYDACAASHLLPAFTFEMLFDDWPNGKSYPVTAAQLLPILTGFLAPIHFSKLAKNRNEDYRLAFRASRLFNERATTAATSSVVETSRGITLSVEPRDSSISLGMTKIHDEF